MERGTLGVQQLRLLLGYITITLHHVEKTEAGLKDLCILEISLK